MYEHVKTGCKHIPPSEPPLQFQSGYFLNKPCIANANCHWSNYTKASERMHMYIWEMACDSSCLSVDLYSPPSPSDLSTNKKCALLAKFTVQLTLPTFVWTGWLDNWRGIYRSTYSMPEGELWQIKSGMEGVDLQLSFFPATLMTILQYVVYHN
jgi:hypothetical protein